MADESRSSKEQESDLTESKPAKKDGKDAGRGFDRKRKAGKPSARDAGSGKEPEDEREADAKAGAEPGETAGREAKKDKEVPPRNQGHVSTFNNWTE